MTKYIELTMVPEYNEKVHVTFEYVQDESPAHHISRDQLLDLVTEFCDDIQSAHGMSPHGRIDENALDWPDLADTYRKANALLRRSEDLSDAGLTAEQLDDRFNPDGDGQHPVYLRENWVVQVRAGNTLVGYWDWVVAQIEEADHD